MLTNRSIYEGRLQELDSLKGIGAIVITFFFHYKDFWCGGETNLFYQVPVLWNLAMHGQWFVELFFMLSGFTTSLSWNRKKLETGGGSFSRYFLKRVFRIYPSMLVAIVLAYSSQWTIRLLTGETWISGGLSLLNLYYALLGIERWIQCNDPVIPALWFIGPLMACSILFFILANAQRSKAIFAAPVLLGAFLSGTEWTFAFFNQRMGRGLFSFFLGVLLCIAMEAMENNRNRNALERFICFAMLFWLAFVWMICGLNLYAVKRFQAPVGILGDYRLFLSLAVFPCVIYLAVKWNPLHWLLCRSGLVVLGKLSFGIYLWHEPVYYWIQIARIKAGCLKDTTTVGFFALAAILVLTTATVSYCFLEKPAGAYLEKKILRAVK